VRCEHGERVRIEVHCGARLCDAAGGASDQCAKPEKATRQIRFDRTTSGEKGAKRRLAVAGKKFVKFEIAR